MATEERYGGCLCGDIRYRLNGDPAGGDLCHCRQCRRQTGTLVAAFVTYPRDRVSMVRGAVSTYRSSDRAVRQFCGRCGSHIFWIGDGADTFDVFLGTLDDPAEMPVSECRLWTENRLPWWPDMPKIPAFRQGRATQDGT